jgi:predicted PolB exonuclease-like 3'-5' exonuclease
MRHKSLFVFDIETIPDTEAVFNLTGSKTKDIKKLREELEAYHIEVSKGNPFPRQPFHKIVAISFVEAQIERDSMGNENYIITDVRSGGVEESSEEELVKGAFSYLSKKTPRIVSYNGRGFDLPVMKYRAMKYGVSAPWLYKSGDKWNNYMSRYSADWHCDLLESLSDFGASCRCKMNEVCAITGIPGKIGVDGSKVTDLYDKGDIKAIRDYCETDVLNTYLLYLVYQQHIGTITRENFLNANKDLVNYLDENKSKEKLHFDEFLQEWKKVDEIGLFK